MKLKPRKKGSHKGQNGKVLIIGGSEDYVGAPAFVGLAAMAVIRAGADLVTIIAPEKVAWAINCIAPDLMTKKVKCRNFTVKQVSEVLKEAKTVDVVVIGNGIAFTPGAKQFMQKIIRQFVKQNKKLVIDAAALRGVKLQEVSNAVLLPHGGELTELLKNSKLTEKKIQRNLGSNVLVKKGYPKTVILSKTKKAINTTGNAGMTHGGTGDVLAGIIAGLIAQGNDLFISAKIGCYVNGKSADNLFKKQGLGYVANDLVSEIPFVLKKFQKIK
ncbi:NAD(P)H-hydrate dehydratase [Candidatus Woesearchaeota archaeon CG10_big_fil_rev_8_21_14_0_10_37_12]|nr:MAG: NAD(P)H-hydrate dehydratase [Candidatus Woesearchaeota archaeon CG10_big_fil_rev_8_21_14_0_10_37_12]